MKAQAATMVNPQLFQANIGSDHHEIVEVRPARVELRSNLCSQTLDQRYLFMPQATKEANSESQRAPVIIMFCAA